MVEITIVRYLEKCYGKYKSVIATEVSLMASDEQLGGTISGKWAQNEELLKLVRDNTYFKNQVC